MFKLPIELLDDNDQKNTTSACKNDLQLDVIFNDLLGEQDKESAVRKIWLTKFTTNREFLKNTQDLLHNESSTIPYSKKIKQILDTIKNNPSFREKFEYITIDYFEKLNKNEPVLQAISMYTLTSPILSLLTPIIMLFIPFFILRVMGKSITISNYIEELKKVFSMLPIGKLFQLGSASWDQRGLILFSVILYFVQMYQNTLTCYKFYKNTKIMVKEIHECGYYCNLSAASMEHFSKSCEKYATYLPFIEQLSLRSIELRDMATTFLEVKEETHKDMGKKMKVYFDLFSNKNYEECFNFSFGYNEYLENINSLRKIKSLNTCKFSDKKFTIKNSYYSLLRYLEPIKNTYSMSKNAILSGPNASGKTTLLKSTMINILLSQQIGMGFYDKATIIPQDYLHCYINIPDSCDRDSLFQAEARRCKDILDIINKDPSAKHICVFDELFSGTNPYEAIACAYSYLNYLHKNKNVKYLLTTHYLELCEKYSDDEDNVINYTLEKQYSLQKGISKIKGGIKVIQDLDFPVEIISSAKKMVS